MLVLPCKGGEGLTNKLSSTDWIPESFQAAARKLAKDAANRFLSKNQVIGLGSGPMAVAIIKAMSSFDGKQTLKCVPTSFQSKLEAERSGLELVDETWIPEVDVVFDGADEVDNKFNMIKGGGGALLREKILHSAAKKIIITAEYKKFVSTFTWPVPIEVHPFAIHTVKERLGERGNPKMRMLTEGYPYVTENGNFILDTSLDFSDISAQEKELKNIAGIVEVGLFTRKADVYYKANEDGSFEAIELSH